MDLLQEPDIKKTYDKCKYIVKLWELKFTKQHKRLPSKLDIREASTEVRHAYRRYFQLKTAALEQSFMDVEGFDEDEVVDKDDGVDCQKNVEVSKNVLSTENSQEGDSPALETIQVPEDVWGAHLNNKKDDHASTPKTEEAPKLNLKITKKLFCGSKFAKRNPRKSLSFSQKNKSDMNLDKEISLSQPATFTGSHTSFTSEESILTNENETLLKNNHFQIKSHDVKIFSQPLNIIQSILDNSAYRSLKTVDSGWLERVVQKTGTSIENPNLILPIISNASEKSDDSLSQITNLNYDSDDIIEESDEEDIASLHIAKKRKLSETHVSCTSTKISESPKGSIAETNDNKDLSLQMHEETITNVDENIPPTVDKESSHEEKGTSSNVNTKIYSNVDKETSMNSDKMNKKSSKAASTKFNKKKTREAKNSPRLKSKNKEKINHSNSEIISPRRSARKNRVKVSLQEFSSSEEDAFHTDNDEEDPEFTLDSEKTSKTILFHNSSLEAYSPVKISQKKISSAGNRDEIKTPVIKSKKRSRSSKKVGKELEEESKEDKPYELEFSVKPRVVTPRYTNLKSALLDNTISVMAGTSETMDNSKNSGNTSLPKDKRQQAKENLEKKIASGNLNDNFLRINIKKKVFVRGKSRRNFSKYKKAQWKSNKAKALAGPEMDMGGCDGGMLTCFNCGQIGHFARNCKGMKGDGLLPLNAGDAEAECPYPTLEEASQMAQESVLHIRKPKLILKEQQNIENDQQGSKSINTEAEQSGSENNVNLFDDDEETEHILAATLKLEEYVKRLDVSMYMDKVKYVEPYFKLKADLTVIDTPVEVFETLQKFGHSSFRPGQEQAVMRILSGKSTLVTLSTGSGKSLCYQLPAYLYSQREPCISLVISPLVSLMDDQITGIAKFMKAGCLHSNQTKSQREKILEAIAAGDLSVLLISPEAIVAGERQTGFGSFLRKLPPIAFACIDEAHCVSQWSHNFRPSYLMICRVLRESLGVKTILGLTATATKSTRQSIIKHLQIPDGENGVISDTPLPNNLILTVSKDVARDRALVELLMSDRFAECKSIIVYCTRRDECERIAAFLRTSLKSERPVEPTNKKRKRVNLQAEPYHAGLSASRRRTIQNSFMSGELRIVVATVAFGMGINKSDIRAVIHFNMPSSFESYVQEVGRAGRDGLKAQCHVFLDSQGRDENELRRHIYANSTERHVIRKLLEKIFIPCSCTNTCPKHEVAFSIEATVRALDIPEENISTLMCYLELHPNKYIQLLSPVYTICKIISYGGPLQIRKVAKDCPPLAMALALHKTKAGDDPNVLEFPVVDVAAAMGWESGICKHKLKNLEWITVNNQPKRSTISVQFSNLGFRLLAPGNLSDDQLDEALDSLYERVCDQEQKALLQLRAVHKTLLEVTKSSYRGCLSDESDDLTLKTKIREYFNSSDPLQNVEESDAKKFNEDQLVADIHALIFMYRDNSFTGRAVARIFQGIQSPNYPAVIWGRCKFWRSHLDKDFHTIVKIATREIIKMR